MPIAASGASLVFGIGGTTLAFIGMTFWNEALTRWKTQELQQWRWGNRQQLVGFAFVIAALLVK